MSFKNKIKSMYPIIKNHFIITFGIVFGIIFLFLHFLYPTLYISKLILIMAIILPYISFLSWFSNRNEILGNYRENNIVNNLRSKNKKIMDWIFLLLLFSIISV